MSNTRLLITRALFPLILLLSASFGFAQTSTFTYQGRLTDGGTPANGIYDLQFALFDGASSGGQIGSNQTVPSVSVSSGVFTVSLDFGANAFSGANRFLQISARLNGSGSFTLLTPRQQITSTPYAVRSLGTTVADGLSSACAGCVQDSNINGVAGSKVSGTIPVAGVPAGSTSYIQNSSSPQNSSDFNISGSGTANIFNAVTQYNLGGVRVLRAVSNGTFVGWGAGPNTTGGSNAFFGSYAGNSDSSGTNNAFFGNGAGLLNTTGSDNSFFGGGAGASNVTASSNSFFGNASGFSNTSGTSNSFFGSGAGAANKTGADNSFFGTAAGADSLGHSNSFFGASAGYSNTSGATNSFFGIIAGLGNTTGFDNTFVGDGAGKSNTTGNNNTVVGARADVGADGLNHATAVGAGAVVSTSNTITLGRSDGSDVVDVPGKLQIDTLATAGSTQLCLNGSNRVGTCSSSLRYKTNLAPYQSGMSVINRLRPISFTWKDSRKRDVGFGAEDVEKIDPLLVIYNANGEVEGVKYDRINVVLVNALREQQNQIERQRAAALKQQEQLKTLQTANAALEARLSAMERALPGIGVRRRAAKGSTK